MKFLQSLAIAILAVFAPIKAAVITVGVLVFGDLVLGIMAARHRGEEISSAAIRRTVSKLMIYEAVIMLCFLGETYLLDGLIPAVKILCGLIALTELKSVLESAEELHGGSIFKSVAKRLGSDNDILLKRKKRSSKK